MGRGCFSQFGIGVVSLGQFTIASYDLAQFALACSCIAQFAVYVDHGLGQVVVKLTDLMGRF